MPEIQEDVNEKVLKFMIKIPRLAGDLAVAALRLLLKKLEQREPVGKQTMDKLMSGNNAMRGTTMAKDTDMKSLERLARQHKVGVSIVKNPDQSYTLYFRTRRADQMKQCLEAYTQYKFAKGKAAPIPERLNRAAARAAEQNCQKAAEQGEPNVHKERTRERGR